MSSRPGATGGSILLLLGSAVFIGALIYSFITVGRVTASADNQAEVKNAVQTLGLTNGALVLFLGILAFLYVRADRASEQSYIFLMLHANLFLSILAVSVAVLSKA